MKKRIILSIILAILLAVTSIILYFQFFYTKTPTEKFSLEEKQYLRQKNIDYLEKESKKVYDCLQAGGNLRSCGDVIDWGKNDDEIFGIVYGGISDEIYYLRSEGFNNVDENGGGDDIEVTHLKGEFIVGQNNIVEKIKENFSDFEVMQYYTKDMHM